MKRRLTTIVAADIAEFSRLVGADEEGTLAEQRVLRTELVDPLIAKHGGRIANTAGDSLLIEFPSTVDAVRCAMAVQNEIAIRNADVPADRRIQYRFGINVGDVVADQDDLLGDGVNIAARLEALADPGGIVISGSAHDQLRSISETSFEDLGELRLKNIETPVRAWRVGSQAAQPPSIDAKTRRPVIGATLAALSVAIVAIGYWFWDEFANAPSSAPDASSIAVLPFQDLSETPQEWFGDGMAEDILTDLSKLPDLFVIARNSSFQYRGDGMDLRMIGRELNVAYLLEGSVRRSGDRLRINAQLIDAASGGHVWAERYDGAVEDVFDLQDRVTKAIVESLALKLTESELAAIGDAGTDSAAAHEAYLQGLSYLHRPSFENFVEAKRWLDRSLDLDPEYSDALGARANLFLHAHRFGWTASVGISESRFDVIDAVKEALTQPSALAYLTEADLLEEVPNLDAAKEAIDRGLAISPNNADLTMEAGWIEAALGNHLAAASLAERALRLNPLHPPTYDRNLGAIRYFAGDNEGAIEAFNRALARNPADWHANLQRAASLAELGRIEEAAADLAVVRENWPASWGAQFTAPIAAWLWGLAAGPEFVERMRIALAAAGASEFPPGYDLTLDLRLDIETSRREFGKKGYKAIGRCCGGGEWMNDVQADGEVQNHWNGVPVEKYTRILNEDDSTTFVSHDRYGQTRTCETFRNPAGSNDTFDKYIGVCTHGIYPFGIFPLPN